MASSSTDPIADLLRILRVRGVVYFVESFSAPWGMRIPSRTHAQFHVVLSGDTHVTAGGCTFKVNQGDVVLFPHGTAHSVFDGTSTDLIDGRALVQATVAGKPPFQHGPPSVQLLSGHFEFDRQARHPLPEALPEIVHVALADDIDATLFAVLFPLLKVSGNGPDAGSESIVARLCEIFLVQALRAHFARVETQPGLLQAMFDPRLGRAIAQVHARWKERLTVTDLARSAGMSRSVFSEKFVEIAGTTPMVYLARWRLLQARNLLLETELSVAEVAEASGHGSPESFSRSFKELYGVSPSRIRISNQ